MASNNMSPPPPPVQHTQPTRSYTPPGDYFPSSQTHGGQAPPSSQMVSSQNVPDTQMGDGGSTEQDLTEPSASQQDDTEDSLQLPREDDSVEIEQGRSGAQPTNYESVDQRRSLDADDMHDAAEDLHMTGGDGTAHDNNLDGADADDDGYRHAQEAEDAGGGRTDAEFVIDFDWAGMLHRFRAEMEQKRLEEQQTMQRYEQLQKLYRIWAAKGADRESTRAAKRLCTRMQHVQHSESLLQTKRDHRDKVVNAFESAMRLFD